MLIETIILGVIVVATVHYRSRQKYDNKFTIFFVFGKIYVPWITKIYENFDQVEFIIEQLISICRDEEKNTLWREVGITELSIIRSIDNVEIFSVALHK